MKKRIAIFHRKQMRKLNNRSNSVARRQPSSPKKKIAPNQIDVNDPASDQGQLTNRSNLQLEKVAELDDSNLNPRDSINSQEFYNTLGKK